MKTIFPSSGRAVRLFSVVLFAFLSGTQMLVAQPVWPDSWMSRKPVIITLSGATLTDYQVKVELNSGNFDFIKAQSDGGDIRFTDEDGSTLLPFWIEEWAPPVSATVWVRVPEITADEKTIYLYYSVPRGPEFGLTPAVSTGSGAATFLFFDDFETGAVDPARWTAVGGPSVSVVDDNGNQVAMFTGPGAPDGHDRYLMSNSSFGDFIVEMKVNMTVDANDDCTPEVGLRITDNDNRYITMLRGDGLIGGGGPDGDLLLARIEGGVETSPPSYQGYDYTANQYYDYRIAASGTEISAWLDDLQVGTTWDDAGSLITSGAISLTNYGGTTSNPVYFDNIRVRTYSDDEPVTTLVFNEYKVWIGGTSSVNWNSASYWSPSGVPASGDNVTIPSGARPYITGSPFPVNVFTECADLTVGSSATLTVRPSGDLSVHGDLIISGTMQITSSDDKDGGSLIVDGSCTGTINFYRAFRSGYWLGDRHFFASPVSGLALSVFTADNSAKIAHDGTNYQIWQYQEADDSWPLITGGSFASGRGYNLDLAGERTDSVMRFRGTYVKTAAVTASSPYVTGYTARANAYDYGLGNTDPIWTTGRSWENYGGGGWNLLGNPFTSSMDAAVFISENAGKFDPWYQALYLYNGLNNEYRYAASTVSGWEEPFYEEGGQFGGFVQTGQGFYALALYDNIVFNFNSATMQKHALPGLILMKSAGTETTWPGLKLTVTRGDKVRSALVVYNDDMTEGLDPGYDVGQLSGDPDVEIYTSLTENDNGVNLARQALPLSDFGKYIIPVGIDTEKGGEVTFSAVTVPYDGYTFWLEDRLADVFTDLNTNSYTVTLPPETYGPGRFFIIASANTPTGVEKPVTGEPGLRIWASNGKAIISGEVSDRAYCQVFDLQGNRILEKRLGDTGLNTVDLPSELHGVYIVRVIDGVRVTTRKIALL